MGQKKHKGDSHHNASIVAALISEKACLRANQKRLGLQPHSYGWLKTPGWLVGWSISQFVS